jgi:hypothetical protein
MELEGFGYDTIRAQWKLENNVPVLDSAWQDEMLQAGFRDRSSRFLDGDTVVRSDLWTWQDSDNDTLRIGVRAGQYVMAEFSAPRLLDDSPVNLSLVTGHQVGDLLADVKDRFISMTPGDPVPVFEKILRADYAVDLAAGDALAGVISASAQFKLPRARKVNTNIYPGETATVRSAAFTFRSYGKGLELEYKLSPKERIQYSTIIKTAQEKGLTRMEFSDRRRGGLTYDSLSTGASDFASHLEHGFSGGRVYIEGLNGLQMEIDQLPVSSQRKSSLIAFAVRYATLGRDGMQAAYSRPTFYRQQRQFLEHGLRLDDVCSYQGEIDFRPVIEHLRAA